MKNERKMLRKKVSWCKKWKNELDDVCNEMAHKLSDRKLEYEKDSQKHLQVHKFFVWFPSFLWMNV